MGICPLKNSQLKLKYQKLKLPLSGRYMHTLPGPNKTINFCNALNFLSMFFLLVQLSQVTFLCERLHIVCLLLVAKTHVTMMSPGPLVTTHECCSWAFRWWLILLFAPLCTSDPSPVELHLALSQSSSYLLPLPPLPYRAIVEITCNGLKQYFHRVKLLFASTCSFLVYFVFSFRPACFT